MRRSFRIAVTRLLRRHLEAGAKGPAVRARESNFSHILAGFGIDSKHADISRTAERLRRMRVQMH